MRLDDIIRTNLVPNVLLGRLRVTLPQRLRE